jgi:hypothetical protein
MTLGWQYPLIWKTNCFFQQKEKFGELCFNYLLETMRDSSVKVELNCRNMIKGGKTRDVGCKYGT